jgi:CRP-like cAMP-binding protein
MYAEPIIDRIQNMLGRRDQIANLIEGGWKDRDIAKYLGSDRMTILRFRRLKQQGLLDKDQEEIIALFK